MKTITKSEGTLECLQSAQKAGWNWDEFHKKAQADFESVRALAVEEQGNECAYTGLWIGEGTHSDVHIDHFRKKSIYPEATFCWKNLFAAVKNPNYGADYKDKQIHSPQANADRQYQAFWSPLQPTLSEAFWYRQDGTIEPDEQLSLSEKATAQQTIDMYNLNSNELKNRRQGVILTIRNMRHQLADQEVRTIMDTVGFSFLVDFELRQSHIF